MVDPIISRINRIEGQIAGIKKMYESGRSCSDIVQQTQAVRAALGKFAGTILTNEAKRCSEEGKIKELKEVVDQTFKTI